MKYENPEHRGRYARALKGTQNLADLVCYQPVDDPAMLPPELRQGLSPPSSALILLPAVDLHVQTVEKAVRETRIPVVAVEGSDPSAGLLTFYFTVFLPRLGQIGIFRAMRLWVDLDKQAYLVPDVDDDAAMPTFIIDRGLRQVAAPWQNPIVRGFGFAHADAILLAP